MFQKGKSGNPKGKSKGKLSRNTTEIRDRLQLIIDNNIDTLQADLLSLEPKDMVRAVGDLLSSIMPKRTLSDTRIAIEQLSPEQIDQIIQSLTNDEGWIIKKSNWDP